MTVFPIDGDSPQALFLTSPRAHVTCTRELDRLSEGIVQRAETIGAQKDGLKVEVRRSPGRCFVQLGPVALSVTWLPGKPDTVLQGRLLVIEWEGTIKPGGDSNGGRGALPPTRTATPMRESVLVADATGPADWTWRHEDKKTAGFTSRVLAEQCMDSILTVLETKLA